MLPPEVEEINQILQERTGNKDTDLAMLLYNKWIRLNDGRNRENYTSLGLLIDDYLLPGSVILPA